MHSLNLLFYEVFVFLLLNMYCVVFEFSCTGEFHRLVFKFLSKENFKYIIQKNIFRKYVQKVRKVLLWMEAVVMLDRGEMYVAY